MPFRIREFSASWKEDEINNVALMQQAVEIKVGFGGARSVLPLRRRGVERSKSKKLVRVAARRWSLFQEAGSAA